MVSLGILLVVDHSTMKRLHIWSIWKVTCTHFSPRYTTHCTNANYIQQFFQTMSTPTWCHPDPSCIHEQQWWCRLQRTKAILQMQDPFTDLEAGQDSKVDSLMTGQSLAAEVLLPSQPRPSLSIGSPSNLTTMRKLNTALKYSRSRNCSTCNVVRKCGWYF